MAEKARGLDAALIVAEHLPREEDGTATIMEVAQRRDVLLGYLREAQAERDRYRAALEKITRHAPSDQTWSLIRSAQEALDG